MQLKSPTIVYYTIAPLKFTPTLGFSDALLLRLPLHMMFYSCLLPHPWKSLYLSPEYKKLVSKWLFSYVCKGDLPADEMW
jgi:hypothetical protein